MKMISIIIPCFNEEESLEYLKKELDSLSLKIPCEFEYIFIDDGSNDDTLNILKGFNEENNRLCRYISFSRNFGKESAMLAGMIESKGDYVTILDADLQDPPELLIDMWDIIQKNDLVDSVAAQRIDRKGEGKILSICSNLFYIIIGKFSKTKLVPGVRDYRLMKRRVINEILKITEVSRFSKGIFSWVGFNTVYIPYHNRQRLAGKTKWGINSKINYAWSGIVNYSEAPLNFSIYLGAVTVVGVFLTILFLIIRQLFFKHSVNGWTSLIITVLFCFGFTMIILGVIGKYLGTIFLETKNRPKFVVKDRSE